MLVTYQQRSFIHCLSFCLLFFVLFLNQSKPVNENNDSCSPTISINSVGCMTCSTYSVFIRMEVQRSTIKTKTEIIHRNLNGFHIEFKWIKPQIVELFRSLDTIKQNNMREFFR